MTEIRGADREPAEESPAATAPEYRVPGSGERLRWIDRARAQREQIRARPRLYLIYKVALGLIGAVIVVVGLILVPLNGPGWLIVFAGLALLATEFTWAKRLETFARRHVMAWTAWVLRQSLLVRGLLGLTATIFSALVLYVTLLITGVPGFVPDSWVALVPGLS